MAFTIAKSGAWLSHTETVTVVDSDGTYNSSEVPVLGETSIMTNVEEEGGLVGKVQYTEDDLIGAIGGVGADPTAAKSSSTQTWVDLEDPANVADSTLEVYALPANAKKVRVQYTVTASGYGGDLGHAVVIYTSKQKKSNLGFSVDGTLGVGTDQN